MEKEQEEKILEETRKGIGILLERKSLACIREKEKIDAEERGFAEACNKCLAEFEFWLRHKK